jgi:natural product precursor
MKDTVVKKLRLNKETVRKLNDAELKRAVGGTGLTVKGCDCKGTSTYGPSEPMIC